MAYPIIEEFKKDYKLLLNHKFTWNEFTVDEISERAAFIEPFCKVPDPIVMQAFDPTPLRN